MAKTVRLSVHKNSVERKRAKNIRSDMTAAAKEISSSHDVRAYALVAIASDGSAHASWDTGSIMPMWAFSATIHEVLSRDVNSGAVEETWQPPLPLNG